MKNIGELMEMMGQFATQEQAEQVATRLESHGCLTIDDVKFLDPAAFALLMPDAQVDGEPLNEELDAIYTFELELPITVAGHCGTISYGAGGWGNAAIHIEMADGTKLFARERESEDYENVERDSDGCFEPDALEVYNWERIGDEGYYSTISNALAQRENHNRAL